MIQTDRPSNGTPVQQRAPAATGGAAANPPILCTICGQRPATIRESPILGQRNLCLSCHRRALLTLRQPRPPERLVIRTGQRCPTHPGTPAVLANPQQYPHLTDLGSSAEEIAAAGILVRCAVPHCGWWAWDGLVPDSM